MRYSQDLPDSLATHDHCSHLSAHCEAPFPRVQPPLPAGSETSQCLLDKLPCWQTSLPGSGALAGSKPLVSPFPKRNMEHDEYLQNLLVHSLRSRQTGERHREERKTELTPFPQSRLELLFHWSLYEIPMFLCHTVNSKVLVGILLQITQGFGAYPEWLACDHPAVRSRLPTTLSPHS